jgi:hypothetical protein
MSHAPIPQNPGVPLDAVISTDELARRPARPADDQALIKALMDLSKEMANRPRAFCNGSWMRH